MSTNETNPTKLSEEEETAKEFSEAINLQKTDSIKTKLLALYKNQQVRDGILEKGYNEDFYNLEYKYNLQYSSLNKEISEIVNQNTPIPNYWKVVVENSKFFTVNDKDKEILKYLTNIEIKHDETDKKSFTAYFTFSSNSFFDETVIQKFYKFNKKEDSYTESTSTQIKWKGDAPNVKVIKKKIKKGKNVSTVTKEKKVKSFFNIFEEENDDEDTDDDKGDEDESNLSSEADFIQNDLIPFSMEYYLDLQKLSAIDDHIEDEDDGEESEGDDKKKKKK
jgi:nucleosome assembly protein 1-like 1